jgi:uncharacterized paraquat-inducible protein A
MTPLGFVMAGVLILVTVILVAVPYLRAGRDPVVAEAPPDQVRMDIERRLHENYCLDCGMRLEHAGQSPCPHCGAPGPVAP